MDKLNHLEACKSVYTDPVDMSQSSMTVKKNMQRSKKKRFIMIEHLNVGQQLCERSSVETPLYCTLYFFWTRAAKTCKTERTHVKEGTF